MYYIVTVYSCIVLFPLYVVLKYFMIYRAYSALFIEFSNSLGKNTLIRRANSPYCIPYVYSTVFSKFNRLLTTFSICVESWLFPYPLMASTSFTSVLTMFPLCTRIHHFATIHAFRPLLCQVSFVEI